MIDIIVFEKNDCMRCHALIRRLGSKDKYKKYNVRTFNVDTDTNTYECFSNKTPKEYVLEDLKVRQMPVTLISSPKGSYTISGYNTIELDKTLLAFERGDV